MGRWLDRARTDTGSAPVLPLVTFHAGNSETRKPNASADQVGSGNPTGTWEEEAAWGLFHHTNQRIVSHLLPPGEPWDSLWWERSEAMRLRDWPALVRVCARMVTAAGR